MSCAASYAKMAASILDLYMKQLHRPALNMGVYQCTCLHQPRRATSCVKAHLCTAARRSRWQERTTASWRPAHGYRPATAFSRGSAQSWSKCELHMQGLNPYRWRDFYGAFSLAGFVPIVCHVNMLHAVNICCSQLTCGMTLCRAPGVVVATAGMQADAKTLHKTLQVRPGCCTNLEPHGVWWHSNQLRPQSDVQKGFRSSVRLCHAVWKRKARLRSK